MVGLCTYAIYSREQFYPIVLFLVTSKISFVVAGNMILATALLLGHVSKAIFLGQLRDVEIELLTERAKYTITETCLALTIFRNELSPSILGLFGALLFLKAFHWLGKGRLEHLEQIMPVGYLTHIRLTALVIVLALFDVAFAYSCMSYTMEHGKSVLILFGFEFGVLVISIFNLSSRYALHLIDARQAHGLTGKALYGMVVDLVCDALKFVTYVIFFSLVFVYYGLPIHLIRELWVSFHNFHRHLSSFIKYLRLTSNLDQRFPDATPEEIEACGDCLICRESVERGKKLPCSHVFHLECLRMWLQHQQTCPLCRADIPVTAAATGQMPPLAGPRIHPLAAGVPLPAAPQPEAHIQQAANVPAVPAVSAADPSQIDFPAFYIVTAPFITIYYAPSLESPIIRSVVQGVVILIISGELKPDGFWLRTPDGWTLEKRPEGSALLSLYIPEQPNITMRFASPLVPQPALGYQPSRTPPVAVRHALQNSSSSEAPPLSFSTPSSSAANNGIRNAHIINSWSLHDASSNGASSSHRTPNDSRSIPRSTSKSPAETLSTMMSMQERMRVFSENLSQMQEAVTTCQVCLSELVADHIQEARDMERMGIAPMTVAVDENSENGDNCASPLHSIASREAPTSHQSPRNDDDVYKRQRERYEQLKRQMSDEESSS